MRYLLYIVSERSSANETLFSRGTSPEPCLEKSSVCAQNTSVANSRFGRFESEKRVHAQRLGTHEEGSEQFMLGLRIVVLSRPRSQVAKQAERTLVLDPRSAQQTLDARILPNPLSAVRT